MQGNLHVPFLGGWVGAIPPGYPADEETYRKATRLVPTQLECDNYSATRQPDSTITAPVCACHLVSYTDTYSRYMSNSYKLSGRCKLRSPAVSGEACLREDVSKVLICYSL
jgi:hypothetical protein